MKPFQLFISFTGLGLELLLLAGTIARGRYRVCLTFPLYLVAVLIPGVLFPFWPSRFYTWDNYILQEVVHSLLKFGIALELGFRVARSFPGALRTGRRLVGFAVLVVAVLAVSTLTTGLGTPAVQVEWHARVLSGTIWVFAAVGVIVLWYRLPIDPFQKAILVGFVAYLFVFSLVVRAFAEWGDAARAFQRAATISYLALLLYWNRAVWSSDGVGTAAQPTQPRHKPQLA